MAKILLFITLFLSAVCRIKVFIILHSHCDVGWLKTVDKYYEEQTRSILENMIKLLSDDPELKFSWSEISFLSKYLSEFPEQKPVLSDLIRSGRLKIVGGGWAQHDEALPDFDLILRQMQAGFTYLRENLNVTKVKVAWQLDPFGHSSLTAALMSKMGFETLVFSRIEDNHRKYFELGVNSEFIWKPEGFGDKDGILTHILNDHYYPPPALDRVPWNVYRCFNSLPALEYEVEYCAGRIEEYVLRAQKKYRTNNHFMIMGGDFFYDNLEESLMFISLIKGINSSALNIDMVFATPSEYFDAVYKEKKEFSVFKGDLLPLVSPGYSYFKSWNGYYSTKPLLKKIIINTQTYVRAAEILSTVILNKEFTCYNLAIATHHDAITGTCKFHVFIDYLKLLTKDISSSLDTFGKAFSNLISKNPQNTQLAVPVKVLLAFNSLSWETEKLLFFEGKSKHIKVFTSDGKSITSQTIPWDKFNRFYFILRVKSYTLQTYFIEENEIYKEGCSFDSELVFTDTLKNDNLEIKLKSGLIHSIKQNGFEFKCKSKLIKYSTEISGAYTFTPRNEEDISFLMQSSEIYSGVVLQLAKSGYRHNNSFYEQVILMPSKSKTFYLKVKLNPPRNANFFIRFQKPYNEDSWFYLFNTLNVMKKTYFTLDPTRLADNYYPVSGSLWINLIEKFFFIVPSFPIGAGIVNNQNFELNLHRNLVSDDELGLSQDDSDTLEVEHEFRMGFGEFGYEKVWKDYLDHRNQPIVLYKGLSSRFVVESSHNAAKQFDWNGMQEIKVLEGDESLHYAGFAKRGESYFANVINLCSYPVELPFKNSKQVQPGWLDNDNNKKKWKNGFEIEMKLHENSGNNVVAYNSSAEKGKISPFELVGLEIDFKAGINKNSDKGSTISTSEVGFI